MPAPEILRRLNRRFIRLATGLLERLGWSVYPSRDYYSPMPVLSKIRRTRQRWNRPSELVGVPVDLDRMEGFLAEIAAGALTEYEQLEGYETWKEAGFGPGFTEVDAFLLYAVLRHLEPKRWLEVGSGLSTYCALQALARNAAEGRPCEMTCIDPFPTERLRAEAGIEIVVAEVQDVPVETFETLEAGDVFFVDSTHVVKVDGDVPFVVLEALPRLASGVVAHFHDVHLPYQAPQPVEFYLDRRKWPWLWTEAMLLQAFLTGTDEWEILLGCALLRHRREEALRRAVPFYRSPDPDDTDTHASSLWLRRRGEGEG